MMFLDFLERANEFDVAVARAQSKKDNRSDRLKSGPFRLRERQFIKRYRLSKELARGLITELTPHLPPTLRSDALDVDTKDGIAVLVKCEEASDILEQKMMEYRQETEIQNLLKELVVMKVRIAKLLTQARQGLVTIQDAKVEMARQGKEIEEQKENVAKLDHWLESINHELQESTKHHDVLVEEDIIRYIEIYERYIREYEEYEIILKSITVIRQDESSQLLRAKLIAMQKALEETRNLVIVEIERLRQVLLHIRSAPEIAEEDMSQTDRTIDSTSMPEEVVSPRETVPEENKEITPEKSEEKQPTVLESKPSHEVKQAVTIETQTGKSLASEPTEKSTTKEQPQIVEVPKEKPSTAIDTQTGQSLMSEAPLLSNKSVICQPEPVVTKDVAVTCSAPQEVEVQTSSPALSERELLENIQVTQTISDGHETIEIASRPIVRDQKTDEKSLLVDASYRDDNLRKNSQLNITHSMPQSFETVLVEPDETTTEVVVDADGTKRIIVKKVRKTLVTRQQLIQTQQHRKQIMSSDGVPQEQSFSQITLKEDKGSTSTMAEDGGTQHVEYQTYGGQLISGMPGSEMTIQEFTSKPDMVFRMEHGMKPDEILQIAEGGVPSHIQTSSSSVTAVVQQVTKRIVRTRRRIIRRIVIIDGKEHVTEEIVDEPDVEVQEEQIPRVSISVKDQSGVQFEEIDDSHDNDDQPPPSLPPGPGKDEKPLKDDKPDDRSPPKDKDPHKERESPKDKESPKEPDSIPSQTEQLQELLQKFMQKESAHSTEPQTIKTETIIRTSQEREQTPTRMVTVSQTYETLPTEAQEYQVQEPVDDQYTLVGGIQSTLQTSSSNIATVTQRVTRKITRTRKRIIKHIQIIDGKEHVTEEVIEEPDDVEVIEEKPHVSTHTVQEQGVKTKRIKIIRQVQIIDGKEHVTEQIVEEPDDEFVPESTITADIDVHIHKPDICEVKEEAVEVKIQDSIITEPQISKLAEPTTDTAETKKLTTVTEEEPATSSETQKNDTVSKKKTKKQKKPISEKLILPDELPRNIASKVTDKKQREPQKETIKISEVLSAPKNTTIIDITKSQISETDYPSVTQNKPDSKVKKESVEIKTQDATISESEISKPPEPPTIIAETKKLTTVVDEKPAIMSESQKDTTLGKKNSKKQKKPVSERPISPADIVSEITNEDQTKSQKKTIEISEVPSAPKDTTIVDITKSLISSESDHSALYQTATKEPVPKKRKDRKSKKDKARDSTRTSEEKSPTPTDEVSTVTTETKPSEEVTKVLEISSSIKESKQSVTEPSKDLEVITTSQITTQVTPSTVIQVSEMTKSIDTPKITKEVIEPSQETKTVTTSVTTTHVSPGTETKEPDEVRTIGKEIVDTVIQEPCKVTETVTISKITTQLTPPTDSQIQTEVTKTVEVPAIDKEAVQAVFKPPKVTETTTTSEVTREVSPIPEIQSDTNIIIRRTSKRVITHVKIIDGKEHVIEEVIEEPEDVEPIEGKPRLAQTLQEQGVKTKHIRIIRKLQIIDGKEHVIDQVVEDDDDEYVPDSSVTADIDVKLSKPEIEFLQQEKALLPDVQKDTFIVDVTKSLIMSEADLSASSQPSEKPVPKKREKKSKQGKWKDEVSKEDSIPDKTSEIRAPATAEIGTQIVQKTVQISQPDQVTSVDTEENQPKVTETITTTKITTVTPTTEEPKDTTIVDITKSLIGSEADHSAALQGTSEQPVPKKREKKRKQEPERLATPSKLVEKEPKKTEEPELIIEKPLKTKKEESPSPPKEITNKPVVLSATEITNVVKTDIKSHPSTVEKLTTEKLDSEITTKTPNGDPKLKAPLPTKETTADFLTKETDDYKQQINIMEITKQLLEKESIHAGAIHSPVKTPKELEIVSETKETIAPKELELVVEQKLEPTPLWQTLEITETKVSEQVPSLETERQSNVEKVPVKSPDQSVTHDVPATSEKNIGLKTTELAPAQKTVEVEPIKVETVVTESIVTGKSESPRVSYIQEFEPKVQSSNDSVDKLFAALIKEPQSEEKLMPSDIASTIPSKSDHKDDVNLLLESERQHSAKSVELGVIEKQPEKLQQTVDISVSIARTHETKKDEPKVQMDLTLGGLETTEPYFVKKDIDVHLPSEVTITKEPFKLPAHEILSKEEPVPEASSEESTKSSKKIKKKKKQKSFEENESVEVETDKSILESDSSSLSHYVELPTSPPMESPKPTKDILKSPALQEVEPDSLVTESDTATEEKGYEAEDVSQGPLSTPDKKKRQKKRKSYAVSEETTYPKLGTTESGDTSMSTPVEIGKPVEPVQQKRKSKKGKKKVHEETELEVETEQEIEPEPEVKPESAKMGEVAETSPRDESYHTMTETSDIDTVKIIEECVQSSPETVKTEISTTITYPVPVVEEISTQEYSVQTSPEAVIKPIKEKVPEVPRPETADTALQTSPTPVSESIIQTSPVEDKEAHTQTLEEVAIVEEIEKSDSQMQTCRSESPEKVVQTEATTQVIPHDITTPEEKCSQTSPIEIPKIEVEKPPTPVVITESREMQTSPLPQAQKEEKSTEITIETTETNIQTVQKDIVDQETCTSPVKEKESRDTSIQTPEVPVVSSYTQSDSPEPVIEKPTPKVEEPKEETIPVPEVPNLPKIEAKKEVITVDSTQQTTPREEPQPVIYVPPLDLTREVVTVDSVQQTTPRDYSESSISTSTDEPYEVHLKAQISIPQATTDFIESERQAQPPQTLTTEKHKQKKRKSKKRTTESPSTPESLSDPITTELSMSETPTSDDFSIKDISSTDEGISQLASSASQRQQRVKEQQRPTYSDVVQRSKSKSPSPSKGEFPRRSEKARLLDAIEKRTQAITEPQKVTDDSTMAVVLYDPSVEKSYDLVVNKELDEVKDAINNNDTTKVERSVIIVIETISIWLEEIQYRIQKETSTGVRSSQDTERLKDLQSHIRHLKEIIEITEVSEEIITLIETLTRQVDGVNNLSSQSSVRIKEAEKEWSKFLDDTEKLSRDVESVKSAVDQIIIAEIPTHQKLEKLDKIESDNVDNFDSIKKMFRRFRSLVEINPKRECPIKLYNCDDDTKQAENVINAERDRLLQLTSLAEEYEQTLQDFGQITDVAEALLDGKIIVSNLDHLHEEIQKHRKFFVNLSHCRAILESLEDNLDIETRSKYASLHNSLHDRATTIIDRAASRAQQMTLAASRWTMLDRGMKEEQQWLQVAHQRVPELTNVTSMDHEQYINLYQSVSMDVSHHHAKILRLISITEGLKGLIVCSGLDNECSNALETLLKLQEDIDSRLTRLTAFKENWMTYDHLIDRIEGWMKTANRELQHITPENITTTGNLRRFWELKAQHEVHNNLKNEAGTQFERALEILPISDEMVQRQFFSKIEDKWRDLAERIGNLHASAIQNISDRDVSSGEKLSILEDELRELRSALDSLKGVIKSEDELNLYIERLQVMTGRIDRIQNELGRLSLLPTAESERLGALLTQSGILNDQLSEELERSLLLKEKIVQVQIGIARCSKSQRRARLTLEECEAAERLGSDVVEKASENCNRLLDDLQTQWRDILALRQALHTLPISLRVCVSPTGLERDISALQETHADLEALANDLSGRLRAKVQLWRRFERQLEMVQGAVREADYMVELLTVQGQVDYDRLLKATEKLETLSESLSRRSGELVGELKDAAAPLEASTEPAVAAQLRRELDDAAAAYEHTCSNLTQLCDKYHKAVDLWKRYRDAAAAVRAFAEHQEGRLHALRPDDAPDTAQACMEQESRVAELRSLAARVAAETGSRALQADADALARRLQLVAGAVQALADLGEARQVARAKAQTTKDMLCDMRQDLAPLHEDGEIVEDKLIALRENLIALGKSEADIAPAKAELPDIDRDVSDEHSIVRILELWQAMFRDTFLHYHRLSTALVRSGDAATALRLWHEYLLDLQSFLSGSVPGDYENLTEHRRLCRVHRNLLASQRSVLMNENKETNNRDLADKFDTLTNLHNETLARIVERHDEVCNRIAAWDDYREIYTELLRWLKEMEREKEKLQLRYVHIKRISKVLATIQNLSDKIPEGKKQSEKLLSHLKKVLEFTEETYGASMRMEYAGIVKRVDNLQASLDTWRDFLTRIIALIGEYETISNDLHKLYSKTQDDTNTYSDDDRLSRPQLKKAIEKYTDLRTKIIKTETQIEALTVIQEQLKECLSPQDIRTVNQRVWTLRQQRSDLEHQLSIVIYRLQERLELYSIFESRLTRFSEWMTTLETRLETSSQSSEMNALDPQDLIRRINSDVQAETALKEREFEWLAETGSALVELSKKDEKSYSKNTTKQLKDVQERWLKLQETGRSRIAKITELLETITQLEERLTEIRLKLHTIESSLTTSVVIEYLTTKTVDEKFREREQIHKSVETESREVGDCLNLCELIFNDADVSKGNFDLRNLRTGVDIVEKKWKNICDMSEHRKNTLKEIRKSAELANSLLPKIEKKLDSIENRVEKIETRKQRGEPEDEGVSKAVIKDLEAIEGDIKRLEDAYSRIASSRGIDLRGEGADYAARLRAAVRRWQQLRMRVDAAGANAHRQFVAAHGKAVVALAEADVRLTRALHLAPVPLVKEEALKELNGVESDLLECQALVAEADRLSVAVSSAAGVSDMVSEYRALFADVRIRLDIARAEVMGDVDTAVQVDTLKWETDASLQVDTLTSKETYRVELASAVKEASESLEALRNALIQQPKDDAGSEELATAAKEIARAGAKPGQTLELAKHLSELLLTECDATEDEAMLKEVESLSLRYEDLLAQAKKRELQINNLRLPHSASYALTCEHDSGRLTCPLCSERNWKQLDNDLWRLEQWLQFAEATEDARTDPPERYDALEDAIQDHREFLLDLDSHKSIVVSLNVVGSHVAQHASSAHDAERVRARLAAANQRWDTACARAGVWQKRLQRALVHNQQFHDIVVELVARLASAERGVRSREPLRLSRPAVELQRDFRRFSELRDELSRAEPRVLALHEAAQLLKSGDAPAHADDICRRLGELRLRLQSLRKLSAVYALKLGAALARQPAAHSALAAMAAAAAPQLLDDEEEQISTLNLPPLDENDVVVSDETEDQEMSRLQRGLRFVCRVARASLPFQALLLLLLGAAALAPHASSDCRSPGLALEPVLRYPEGPPPL